MYVSSQLVHNVSLRNSNNIKTHLIIVTGEMHFLV